jgi:hypothetical protein
MKVKFLRIGESWTLTRVACACAAVILVDAVALPRAQSKDPPLQID